MTATHSLMNTVQFNLFFDKPRVGKLRGHTIVNRDNIVRIQLYIHKGAASGYQRVVLSFWTRLLQCSQALR